MSPTFTLDDVMTKIREVAAERPDYVYDVPDEVRGANPYSSAACFYRHGDEPGCIVGQALDRLGYVVPIAKEGSHSTSVLLDLFFPFTSVVSEEDQAKLEWIRRVQANQDNKMTWGDAVQHADDYAKQYA